MEKIICFNSDKYTDYVIKKYDLQIENNQYKLITPKINIEEIKKEWNILCILGASGSGKSTILKSLGEIIEPTYNNEKSIISQFPNKTPEQVAEAFCSIGLGSVPLWLHRPNELSNGERARLDIAYKILNNKGGIILIDEFTSVVNRTTAKTMSFCLQKYIRELNLKVVLCSCHYDIIEWLQPDFVVNLNNKKGDKATIEEVEYNDYEGYPIVNKKEVLIEGGAI